MRVKGASSRGSSRALCVLSGKMTHPQHESSFDRDTALEHIADGMYRGAFSNAYRAVIGPNGGYVAAVVLRALQAHQARQAHTASSDRSVRSMHLRYLAPAAEASFEIAVRTLREGRSVTVLDAQVTQGERVVVVASAVFGVAASPIAYDDVVRPEARPIDQAIALPKLVPINHAWDMLRAIGGEPRVGEHAETGGYIRLHEPRTPDALMLAAVWDAWPPAPFFRSIATRFSGAVPTLEASLRFYAPLPRPTSTPEDYCLLHVRSPVALDGYLEEHASVFAPDGALLLCSTQVAMLY